eukprot:jgi/Botrbrau1/16434/Bobra.0142s0032.2
MSLRKDKLGLLPHNRRSYHARFREKHGCGYLSVPTLSKVHQIVGRLTGLLVEQLIINDASVPKIRFKLAAVSNNCMQFKRHCSQLQAPTRLPLARELLHIRQQNEKEVIALLDPHKTLTSRSLQLTRFTLLREPSTYGWELEQDDVTQLSVEEQALPWQEDKGNYAKQKFWGKPTTLQLTEKPVAPSLSQVALAAVGPLVVQEEQPESVPHLAVPRLSQAEAFQERCCGLELLNRLFVEPKPLDPCIHDLAVANTAARSESSWHTACTIPECYQVESTSFKALPEQLIMDWVGPLKVTDGADDVYHMLNCPMPLHPVGSPNSSASNWLIKCEVPSPYCPQVASPTICDHTSWKAFVTADMNSPNDCEWLDPVDYDSYSMMAKFADCAPDMSDFVSECPVAAASLQLDWSLMEAKSHVGQALTLGLPHNFPVTKPPAEETPDPNQQVVTILGDLEHKEGKGSSRSHMFMKPRAGMLLSNCKPSKLFHDKPSVEGTCAKSETGNTPVTPLNVDDRLKNPPRPPPVSPGNDRQSHSPSPRAPQNTEDAAIFFLQLAVQQTKLSGVHEPTHSTLCGAADQKGCLIPTKPTLQSITHKAISLDLPNSHQRVLCQIQREYSEICLALPGIEKDVRYAAFLSTKELDAAIIRLTQEEPSSPDTVALLKAYAAMALLKQTAICITHYGISCAYMYLEHHMAIAPALTRTCAKSLKLLESVHTAVQGNICVDHPKQGHLRKCLVDIATQIPHGKAIILGDRRAFLSIYPLFAEVGLRVFQIDRGKSGDDRGSATHFGNTASSALEAVDCVLVCYDQAHADSLPWHRVCLIVEYTPAPDHFDLPAGGQNCTIVRFEVHPSGDWERNSRQYQSVGSASLEVLRHPIGEVTAKAGLRHPQSRIAGTEKAEGITITRMGPPCRDVPSLTKPPPQRTGVLAYGIVNQPWDKRDEGAGDQPREVQVLGEGPQDSDWQWALILTQDRESPVQNLPELKNAILGLEKAGAMVAERYSPHCDIALSTNLCLKILLVTEGTSVDEVLRTLLEKMELVSRSFAAGTFFLQASPPVARAVSINSGRIHTFARFLDFRLQLCVTTSASELKGLLMEVLKVHGTGQSTCHRARDEAEGFFEPPTDAEAFLSKFPSLNPFTAFHLARLSYNIRTLTSLFSSRPLDLSQFPSHLPARALRNFAEDLAWGARSWNRNATAIVPNAPAALHRTTPVDGSKWLPQHNVPRWTPLQQHTFAACSMGQGQTIGPLTDKDSPQLQDSPPISQRRVVIDLEITPEMKRVPPICTTPPARGPSLFHSRQPPDPSTAPHFQTVQEPEYVLATAHRNFLTPAGVAISPVARPHEDGVVDEFGVHIRPLALSDSEDERDNFDHFSMTPLQAHRQSDHGVRTKIKSATRDTIQPQATLPAIETKIPGDNHHELPDFTSEGAPYARMHSMPCTLQGTVAKQCGSSALKRSHVQPMQPNMTPGSNEGIMARWAARLHKTSKQPPRGRGKRTNFDAFRFVPGAAKKRRTR